MIEVLLRAFIDTNIWISAFINPSGPPAKVIDAFARDRFIPVVSQPFLHELQSVLERSHIRRRIRIADADIAATLDRLSRTAIVVSPTGNLHLCRDPRDDILLETALLAEADYVVSRDDDIKRDLDLIAHLQQHGIDVLSVAQFLDHLADS
jgi:putative PIN family toxin of toxin-antitoxin system